MYAVSINSFVGRFKRPLDCLMVLSLFHCYGNNRFTALPTLIHVEESSKEAYIPIWRLSLGCLHCLITLWCFLTSPFLFLPLPLGGHPLHFPLLGFNTVLYMHSQNMYRIPRYHKVREIIGKEMNRIGPCPEWAISAVNLSWLCVDC